MTRYRQASGFEPLERTRQSAYPSEEDMMNWTADELDDETLAKAEAECLDRPSNSAMWDDRLYVTHGPVMSWAERGDDILAESNYLMVLEALQGTAAQTEHDDRDCCWDADGNKIGWGTTDNPHDDDVIDATISDWLVGSLRQIFVRVRDEAGEYTPAFREAVAISLSLRDYPVFDESDYSEREMEAYYKEFEEACDDARRDYDNHAYDLSESAEELTDDQDKVIRQELYDRASNDEDGLTYQGADSVGWEAISTAYAKVADAMVMNGWEALARSLDNPLGEDQLTLV